MREIYNESTIKGEGNEPGLVRGMGVVNLVRRSGTNCYPIDFRIYTPDSDGKTKNDHFGKV